jgi:hypothetical protein
MEDAKTLAGWIKAMPVKKPVNPIEISKPEPPWAKSAQKAAEETSDALRRKVDLGPPCSKLGSNGQQILAAIMVAPQSLAEIHRKLKLPESKIKPMLALLLERGQIEWHDHESWRAK